MSHRRALIASFLFLVFAAASRSPAQSPKSLTVSAGDADRRDAVVPVTLPDGSGPAVWTLTDDAGRQVPLQVGPGGRGRFILGELKAGQTRRYKLAQSDGASGAGGVEVEHDGGALRLVCGGKNILDYQGEMTDLPEGYDPKFKRGGYIHPVFTPSGTEVTDDYPPKHKHHHGVWSPWTKTQFEGRAPDFWNMGDGTGTVQFVEVRASWGGPVLGGFVAAHRFMDLSAKPQPKPALDETWNVSVYRPLSGPKRPYHVFDMVITQTCASDSPLLLPKYHYGGLGFRGRAEWDGKDNCTFLTSEGKDRSNGNESRGKWCYVGGKVEGGGMAGITILCHPDNFRFPQPMRLHPDEPFFCYAPSQLGDWSIDPNKPYVARYRLVAYDGPADKAEIERLWNDYANPPKATVE
jgi:hypothetical protein